MKATYAVQPFQPLGTYSIQKRNNMKDVLSYPLIEIMETFWAEIAILFSNPLNSTSPQRVLHHTSWPILVPETLGIAHLPSSSLLASVPKISWPDLPVAVPQKLFRAGQWRATSANNYFGN